VFSPDVYATRVFEPGGRCTYRLPDGTVAKEARYRVVDAGQVVVEATDGWTDIFKLLPDGRVELEAKYQGVTATRTTGQRKVIAAAPDRAPVDAPVMGVWQPLNMRSNWPVVVLSDRTAFSPTHDGAWTYQASTREFVVTWRGLPPVCYRLAADGERLREAGGTNQWRRWADAAQRARNRARLPDAAALTNLVAGDWTRGPDAGGGLYACLPGGQVVKFKDATRGSVMNRGHFFIFREEGLAVVRWADIWRDYFPLPPGRSEWAGWNNRGEAVVRMRSKP
jgi:hypothetical protein